MLFCTKVSIAGFIRTKGSRIYKGWQFEMHSLLVKQKGLMLLIDEMIIFWSKLLICLPSCIAQY